MGLIILVTSVHAELGSDNVNGIFPILISPVLLRIITMFSLFDFMCTVASLVHNILTFFSLFLI